MNSNKKIRWLFPGILFINTVIDQITKILARKYIQGNPRIPVIGSFFSFVYTENTGAFLSFGHNFSDELRLILLAVIPALIITAMCIFIWLKARFTIKRSIAFGFIAGGGYGNLIDRILFGKVSDFMLLDFGIIRTGVFNIADLALIIGIIILLISGKSSEEKIKTE